MLVVFWERANCALLQCGVFPSVLLYPASSIRNVINRTEIVKFAFCAPLVEHYTVKSYGGVGV
jgi:hypothetical protein